MDVTTLLEKPEVIAGRTLNTNFNEAIFSLRRNNNFPAIKELIAEGGYNFYRYLRSQELANDPNILVLSSRHHYYYDHTELRNTTTLVILKKLNLIKYIDSFLHSLKLVLSPGANFIGYFSDADTQNGSGVISMIYKGLINYMDSRIDRELSREGVSKLLESQGFEVNNMTSINGMTYFRTQNS